MTLEVLDAEGRSVRHLSNAPIPSVAELTRVPFPEYWLSRPSGMPVAVGANRITWDLRYDAPKVFEHEFRINANVGLTPASPEGPLAMPGTYRLRLTVDGVRHEQTVTVRNDPRSPATAADLEAQHALTMRIHGAVNAAWDLQQRADALRAAVDTAATGAPSDVTAAAATLKTAIDAVASTERGNVSSFRALSRKLVGQLTTQETGDHAPTEPMLNAYTAACRQLTDLQTQWNRTADSGLATFNAVLVRRGRRAIARVAVAPPACRTEPATAP